MFLLVSADRDDPNGVSGEAIQKNAFNNSIVSFDWHAILFRKLGPVVAICEFRSHELFTPTLG
jgi:hypothetical protein